MKWRLLLSGLLLCFFPGFLPAQNLVLNPGFEQRDYCPDDFKQFTNNVHDWYSFFSTPDYYVCDFFPPDIFLPSMGYEPLDGAVAGLRWFILDNGLVPYREYLTGTLSQPLEATRKYYLEFSVFWVPNSIAINQYSAHFSDTLVTAQPADGVLPLEPHISWDGGILTDTAWVTVSGCYTARGGEQFVVLGNFLPNALTDTVVLFTSPFLNQKHYTLLDNVGLYALDDLLPSDTLLRTGSALFLEELPGLEHYLLQGDTLFPGPHVFPEEGRYELEVVLEKCGPIGTFRVEVLDCLPDDAAELPPDTVLCDRYSASLPIPDAAWRLNGTKKGGTLLIDSPGVYLLELWKENCLLDSQRVEVADCKGRDDCLFVPNVFSPNGDGYNDYLEVQSPCDISEFRIQIFNRWGALVFSADSPDFRWSAADLPPGPYVYSASYSYRIHNRSFPAHAKGSVTIVR